jgi:hypothetical protein
MMRQDGHEPPQRTAPSPRPLSKPVTSKIKRDQRCKSDSNFSPAASPVHGAMTAWRSRHPLRAAIVLINIKGLLDAAGGSMADVVNQHREQRQGVGCEFDAGRSAGARLAEILVEIEAIAHIGKGPRVLAHAALPGAAACPPARPATSVTPSPSRTSPRREGGCTRPAPQPPRGSSSPIRSAIR